jgi:hypothetical protein
MFVTAEGRREWMAPLVVSVLAAIVFHAVGHNPFTELFGGGDGYITGLPSKIFAASLSSWNPWVQLGAYSYQDVQFQPFYLPGLIVMRLLPTTFGYNVFILAHYAAAGLLGYLFFRNLGFTRFAALFGGLCFELNGFLLAHKGHTAIVCAAVWLPLMLWAVDRYFATRAIRHLATGALAVSMSLLGGFPQITLYAMMLTGAYAIWRAATIGGWTVAARIRGLALTLAIGLGLGVLISAIQIVPVVLSLPQMTREQLTYAAFSGNTFPISLLLCFVVPNLFGGLYGVLDYAVDLNIVETYAYMGLLPLTLAMGAAFACPPVFRDTRFWVGATLVALVLAFGPATPLHPILFHVPGYNLFRASGRHLFEVHFAITVLAAAAVNTLTSPAAEQVRRRLLRWTVAGLTTAVVVTLAISQLLLAAARFVNHSDDAALRGAHVNPLFTAATVAPFVGQNLRPSSVTLILAVLAAVLSLATLIWLWKRPQLWLARLALCLVCAADIYVMQAGIYVYPDTTFAFEPEHLEEVAVIRARGYDVDRDRIYPIETELTYTYPVLNYLSGLRAINGYTPMWTKRYQYFSRFYANGVQDLDRVADPRLLSVTSARFLLSRSAAIRQRLLAGSLPVGMPAVATFTPAVGDWTRLQATAVDDGFDLRAPAPNGLSLVSIPMELQPDTVYRIRFDVRAPDGEPVTYVVDLQGRNYDKAEQDRTLSIHARDFESQSVDIDTGPDAPATARLRVYTQSPSPLEIRRLSVMTMPPKVASSFEELATTQTGIHVFANHNALPRFRFATSLVPANNVVEARDRFETPGFDYANAVTVEGLPGPQTVAPGEILSQTLRNTVMRWRVRSGERSFFVVGDSYFPGWSARIDGKPAPIYAVDGFLRGVFVEGSGDHDVEMVFQPEKLSLGLAVTGLGLIALVIIWFAGVPRRP